MAKRSFLLLFLATTMLAGIAGTSSDDIQLATVMFTVKDATSKEVIVGAYVNVGGSYEVTGETGSVTFTCAVGDQITYTVTRTGYHSLTTGLTVGIPGSDENNVTVDLNRK